MHKYACVQVPNIVWSTFCHCSHTPFFFQIKSIGVLWCMSAECLLSPLLFCQRLQRLFHKGPSPGLPQTQSSPQQISFTPNPGDTVAISAANSILQQPAARLSQAAKTCQWGDAAFSIRQILIKIINAEINPDMIFPGTPTLHTPVCVFSRLCGFD